ncbi:MAG: glycolate oxidase subunit GlcF [Comamonas sp.]
MQTHLSPEFLGTPDGEEAEAILRKCVHCGFCLATCPTYQLMGDELDSPRGRIYLMKQVLEGQEVTRKTQEHLDRCLTCRNCETTCPSGVEYGKLLDIGRRVVEEKVARPPVEKTVRWALAQGLPSPLFGPAMKLGQAVRGLLPERLREKVPPRQSAGHWPTTVHARKVLLLAGCVQPSMAPNINGATARVLDAAGIQTLIAPKAGCCGAVKFHLNDQEGGKDEMRANIDAWLPYLESGQVECIVMNASGCGVTVKDYGHALRHDPAYADKAARVSAATRDLSELLPELVPLLRDKISPQPQPYGWHPPCTLQHGQQLRGGVEQGLAALGFELRLAASESHLCCGSAGTYSVLEPKTAHQLRDRKLAHLQESFPDGAPQAILSANIGCITHLQSGTDTPVRHWIEVLDEALTS